MLLQRPIIPHYGPFMGTKWTRSEPEIGQKTGSEADMDRKLYARVLAPCYFLKKYVSLTEIEVC